MKINDIKSLKWYKFTQVDSLRYENVLQKKAELFAAEQIWNKH